jgi:ATP-binding protein involved in chromosome partitioning
MGSIDSDGLKALLPQDVGARVQSLRLVAGPGGGVVTAVLEGSGLNAAARDALEAEVKAVLGRAPDIAEVRVGIVADRAAEAQAEPAAPKGPLILAVGSGKGGVGKSTLSANLAVALARLGIKVGLVDADIYGPSQPRLFANEGVKPEAKDSKMFPVPSKYGVGVLSMGHLIEPGRAIAWRGPMASGALGQLVDAWWGDTEVLVIDLPPGTGDVQLTMIQKHKPAGAVIVSTPQDLALMDANRAMNLFDAAGVPVIGLVENMAGYVCPHCGNVSDPFGSGGVEQAAQDLCLPFLGRVPLDLAIRVGSDAGQPPAAGEGPQAEAFMRIARRVATWLEGQR